MKVHRGSCHCKKVIFEIKAPKKLKLLECNCSICSLSGYLHLVVPKEHFRLLRGNEFLTTYTFNTRTAKHTFCKVCGIKPFYIPRSHPDSYSVNYRCLEKTDVDSVRIEMFDGENWEDAFTKLEKSG